MHIDPFASSIFPSTLFPCDTLFRLDMEMSCQWKVIGLCSRTVTFSLWLPDSARSYWKRFFIRGGSRHRTWRAAPSWKWIPPGEIAITMRSNLAWTRVTRLLLCVPRLRLGWIGCSEDRSILQRLRERDSFIFIYFFFFERVGLEHIFKIQIFNPFSNSGRVRIVPKSRPP